jgi:hypothetical protein
MHCYYCIMTARGNQVADLCVLPAKSDQEALACARDIAASPGSVDCLKIYHGERLVASLDMRRNELREAA